MGKFGNVARHLLFLAILLLAPAAHSETMGFEIVPLGDGHCGARCPKVISARGEIREETAGAFLSFLNENLKGENIRSIILLDSPGGKVVAAMDFGQALRRLGMAVIVARATEGTAASGELAAGRCYSACVYALMGGRKRVIPARSLVGVHRMFAYTTSFDMAELGFVRELNLDNGGMRDTLARYSRSMGVSSDLISLAERTSHDKLRLLTGAEIARWRLASRRL